MTRASPTGGLNITRGHVIAARITNLEKARYRDSRARFETRDVRSARVISREEGDERKIEARRPELAILGVWRGRRKGKRRNAARINAAVARKRTMKNI